MSESYQEHLDELHAQQTIPAQILNEVLHEISPSPVISQQRLIAGEANEVYDVALADGRQVIVRISRDAEKKFAQEEWAIKECGRREVPVPEILGIWDYSTEKRPLIICAQRKIEGVLLSQATLSQDTVHQIVVQAGDYLSRIHEVPVKGYGYIDGQGVGEFPTIESEAAGLVAMEAEFQALALQLGLSGRAMSRALQLIIETEQQRPSDDPCLTHNDFCAKHILVAHDTISGIIDFGEVAGSEPLSDFVRWDYYDSAHFPLAWLQEGYANKQVFEGNFRQRLRVKHLAFSLWVMRWYDMQGYTQGVADARTRFIDDLAKLEG